MNINNIASTHIAHYALKAGWKLDKLCKTKWRLDIEAVFGIFELDERKEMGRGCHGAV